MLYHVGMGLRNHMVNDAHGENLVKAFCVEVESQV